MTLGLKISSYENKSAYDSGVVEDEFILTAASCSISNEKTPISSVLPGTEPILIDLGQWKVNIKIDGVADKDYIPVRTQSTNIRVCRRNDIEILGSNIDYSIDANFDYSYPSTGAMHNWYDKFIVLTDISSLGNNSGGITYNYAVKVGNSSVRTNNNLEYVEYTIQLVGYRIV